MSTYKVRLMDKLDVRTTPALMARYSIWRGGADESGAAIGGMDAAE